MALEKELDTYKKKLPSLRAEEGKFALVKGDDLEIFTSYEDALKAGYAKYQLGPFMVKQVRAIEETYLFTRLIPVKQPA